MINNEPAVLAGIVGAILTAAIAFGLPITIEQKEAILGIVAPLYALVSAFWVRSKVTPTTKKA